MIMVWVLGFILMVTIDVLSVGIMTEDKKWSLKGKRVWSYDDLEFEDGSDAYAGRYFKTREDAENDKWTKQYCYIEETIETLREKLIEDVIDIFGNGSNYTEELKRIIDRRFGRE